VRLCACTVLMGALVALFVPLAFVLFLIATIARW
jgi:hypothetical protein